MKIGLMQPYFFPYLGYFDLIYQADLWIVFDTVQYIRRGWINRNRVLHPRQGWQYISVPVKKHSRDTIIQNIEIADHPWREKITGQLQHYRKHAPYFTQTMDLVKSCLYVETTSLSRLNVYCLEQVCQYLDISFKYRYLSKMTLQLPQIHAPDEWALRIAQALGADEYVNPPGGEGLYNPKKYQSGGVKLTIRHLPPMTYHCNGYEFIPNLSIIDVLMWNTPEQILAHLERYA